MEMTVSKILRYLNGSLEYNDMYKIGSYVISHYQKIVDCDFEQLIKESCFSSESVLDFCRHLGKESFDAFKEQMIADHQMRLDQINARMIHMDTAPFLAHLETTYSQEELVHLIDTITDLIAAKKRVIIVGSLYPSSLAVDFQTDLITLGKEVIVYPTFDDRFMFYEDDLVIFLTATGRTLENFVRQKRDKNICSADIVLITQNIRYRGYDHVCADYVLHVLGKFDGIQFNYQLMMILDLLRIRYYQKYY